MDDLISRQAAIDALGEKPLAWTEGEYELGLQNQWQSDVDALNGLPSAQPERMTENREECGMTNFEWMTHDERFVAFWLSEIGCDTCPAFTYCKKRSETVDESCVETLCKWLKCDFKREQIGAEIYKI